jgi:hypothetical protein
MQFLHQKLINHHSKSSSQTVNISSNFTSFPKHQPSISIFHFAFPCSFEIPSRAIKINNSIKNQNFFETNHLEINIVALKKHFATAAVMNLLSLNGGSSKWRSEKNK